MAKTPFFEEVKFVMIKLVSQLATKTEETHFKALYFLRTAFQAFTFYLMFRCVLNHLPSSAAQHSQR